MPTFQSTPYESWVFPDEAYHMNKKGMQPLKPLPFHNSEEPMFGEMPMGYEHARQVALDKVKNTIRARKGMEGLLNTTARSQRQSRPMSRSAVPNGVFHGSPMLYSTNAGIRGGVIYTKEGQQWLETRLKQRAQEYGELASGATVINPPTIAVSPYTSVNMIMSQLYSAFDTGYFSGAIVDLLSKLATSMIEIGAVIEPRQLTTYAQGVGSLIQTIRPLTGKQQGLLMGVAFDDPVEKRRRLADVMYDKLKIVDAIIREIARTMNEPLSARQQVMSQLQQRVLSDQSAQFSAQFSGPERQAALRNPSRTELIQPEEIPYVEPDTPWDAMPPAEPFEGSGHRRFGRRMF